jgi:hypothetical protein
VVTDVLLGPDEQWGTDAEVGSRFADLMVPAGAGGRPDLWLDLVGALERWVAESPLRRADTAVVTQALVNEAVALAGADLWAEELELRGVPVPSPGAVEDWLSRSLRFRVVPALQLAGVWPHSAGDVAVSRWWRATGATPVSAARRAKALSAVSDQLSDPAHPCRDSRSAEGDPIKDLPGGPPTMLIRAVAALCSGSEAIWPRFQRTWSWRALLLLDADPGGAARYLDQLHHERAVALEVALGSAIPALVEAARDLEVPQPETSEIHGQIRLMAARLEPNPWFAELASGEYAIHRLQWPAAEAFYRARVLSVDALRSLVEAFYGHPSVVLGDDDECALPLRLFSGFHDVLSRWRDRGDELWRVLTVEALTGVASTLTVAAGAELAWVLRDDPRRYNAFRGSTGIEPFIRGGSTVLLNSLCRLLAERFGSADLELLSDRNARREIWKRVWEDAENRRASGSDYLRLDAFLM